MLANVNEPGTRIIISGFNTANDFTKSINIYKCEFSNDIGKILEDAKKTHQYLIKIIFYNN